MQGPSQTSHPSGRAYVPPPPKLYERSCQSDTQQMSLGRGEEEEWVGPCFQERDHGVKGVRNGTKRQTAGRDMKNKKEGIKVLG